MEKFIFDLSVIIILAAILSYVAVLLKQPIILAYIACGVLAGPWGMGWIRDLGFIESISRLGITLLLFLAGLCLHPQKLFGLFKKTGLATATNCIVSFAIAFLFAIIFKFSAIESMVIGLALMFSSTILVIKLLPTTRLHQERMGGICISVLIMEDLLAIVVLAYIRCLSLPGNAFVSFGLLLVKLLIFIAILVLLEQFVLRKIMLRVERLHEALFILGLAWCFAIAAISAKIGMFHETGAFFAGVVLARHPISFFITERLKPLRDFFLVLFFFALGAKLDIPALKQVIFISILLAGVFLIVKPWLFKRLFVLAKEERSFSKEIGFRLGQLSEFSLLIAILAFQLGNISCRASQLIQLTTLITFIVSSYIVVMRYPTPIGTSAKLNRD